MSRKQKAYVIDLTQSDSQSESQKQKEKQKHKEKPQKQKEKQKHKEKPQKQKPQKQKEKQNSQKQKEPHNKFNKQERIKEMKKKTTLSSDPIFFEPFEEWTEDELKKAIYLRKRYYKASEILKHVKTKLLAKQIVKDPIH
jgi:hypothetical protein